jgi:hypothetical protein
MSESLLSRVGSPAFGPSPLSEKQQEVDTVVSTFVERATDGSSLASMVVGGLAYRAVRIGALTTGSRFIGQNSSILARFLNGGSKGIGFAGEVVAFEGSQRLLQVKLGGADPSLLRWKGMNGLRRGLLSSIISFGALKGAGAAGRGENPILQNLFQSTTMVSAHHAAGLLKIGEGPKGSLADQFLEAEATVFHMNAGMGLVYGLSPGLVQGEKMLDLSIRDGTTNPQKGLFPSLVRPAWAVAASEGGPRANLVLMAASDEGSGNDNPNGPRRPARLPPPAVMIVPRENQIPAEDDPAPLEGPPAIPGLKVKPLEELHRNERLMTRHPDGTIEVSLKGKQGLTLQDLFDFYQLVFHQGKEFRGILSSLQVQGADIQSLAAHVEILDEVLTQARNHILWGQEEQARHWLEQTDRAVQAFQRGMLEVAGGGRNPLPAPPARALVAPGRPVRQPALLQEFFPGMPPPVVEERAEDPEPSTIQRPPVRIVEVPPSPQKIIPPAFVVFIGQRDWVVDFAQHPRFYLQRGGKATYANEDAGVHLVPDPLAEPGYQTLGVLEQRGDQVVFQPSAFGTDPQVFRNRTKFFVLGSSDKHRGELQITFIPLAQLMVSRIEDSLQAKGVPVSEDQRSLFDRLRDKERSLRDKEVQSIKGFHYKLTLMGLAPAYDPMRAGKSPFEDAVKEISGEEAVLLSEEALPFLFNSVETFKDRACELMKALLPKMSHKAQLQLVPKIIDFYFRSPLKVTDGLYAKPTNPLEILIGPLSIDARLLAFRSLAEAMAGGTEVSQNDLTTLEFFLANLPAQVLEKEAENSPSRPIRLLANGYLQGLPLVKPIYDRYLQSEDPAEFLGIAVDRVRYFLYGGRLFSKDTQNHLAFAFGALDNPEQLSFEHFTRDISLGDLPQPFLKERFQVAVPLVKVAHAQVDKGILQKAFTEIAKVHNVELLSDYLRDVLSKTKQSGLSPVRAELEALAAEVLKQEKVSPVDLAQKMTPMNALEITGKLIKILAAAAGGKGKLKNQGLEVLKNLVLAQAVSEENGQRLLPIIAAYHEKLPSEQLVQVLSALREFYNDAVPEVLKDYKNLKLPSLKDHADRLKKEADKVKIEEGAEEVIEMIPSKSQIDAFAGYVGEDCTKAHWREEIQRPDMQVYRMIADKRLVGMVYVKREVLDGQVVMVIGIEPRARYRVSHRHLLDGVIEGLGELAGERDYDKILISTNSHQRSNRPDMNDAIEKRFSGIPPTQFVQSVGGKIFPGNTFHVAWERPKGLPKGSPPSSSSQRVVGHMAQTIVNPTR